MDEILKHPFYSINDKKPLLVEYQRLFNITLCEHCTGSYFKAYNELKTYYNAMAKNEDKAPATKKYRLKKEFENDSTQISGVKTVITKDTITDEIVEANFDLIKHLVEEVK